MFDVRQLWKVWWFYLYISVKKGRMNVHAREMRMNGVWMWPKTLQTGALVNVYERNHLEGHYMASAARDEVQSKWSFPFGIPLGVPATEWCSFRPTRRWGWCEPSSAEVVTAIQGSTPWDINAQVNHTETGVETRSIRRTRKEETFLVLKKWRDVPAFQKVLDQAVGARADVRALVTSKVVAIRDLDDTTTREEVTAALSRALGRDELGAPCRLYSRFGGIKAAVVQLTEAHAKILLRLGKIRPGR